MDVRGGGQAADERHVQRANGYDSDGEGEGARGKPASTGDAADVTGIGVSGIEVWHWGEPLLCFRRCEGCLWKRGQPALGTLRTSLALG